MKLTENKVKELLKNIQIAKILSFEKHPNADRLLIVQIQTKGGVKQIVTGANNFKVNELVPYLAPGFIVPGFLFFKNETVTLEKRPLRGVDSEGMILAEDEIGLGPDHEGIYIIKGDEKLSLSDELLNKNFLEILSEEQLENVYKNAKIRQLTPAMENKVNLIMRDLEETIGIEDLPDILNERNLKVYWGTAPTGKPSIGYFVPMIKISDFLKAGCEVKILFANIHAFLDNMKSSWELLEYRTEYYKLVISEILKSLGAPLDKLIFVNGTDYQLDSKYTMDMYKIATLTTIQSVKGAGAEVVKQVESPILGGLLYPILQALDEEYLQVDAQLGGEDQRKIFMFAREYLPKLGYKKRIHLMNTLIPGLGKSGKMSSSEPNSKIDLNETDDSIKDKINKAYSIDGEVKGNGLLALLKYVIFRKLEVENRSLLIERPEKWGGNIEYFNYNDLETDFINKTLSSVDLKPAVAQEIINLISPIRVKINQKIDLVEKAYPVT